MVAPNENSYFQVIHHMKLLRNIALKSFPVGNFARNIKKNSLFSQTFFSVGFSLKQYIVPALAFLLKLKYWLKKFLLAGINEPLSYYFHSVGIAKSAWALKSHNLGAELWLCRTLAFFLYLRSLMWKIGHHTGLLQGSNNHASRVPHTVPGPSEVLSKRIMRWFVDCCQSRKPRKMARLENRLWFLSPGVP